MEQINFSRIIFLEKLTPTKELFILIGDRENLLKYHMEMTKIFSQKEGRELNSIQENSLYMTIHCKLGDDSSYNIFMFKDVFNEMISNLLEDQENTSFIGKVVKMGSISCKSFRENRYENLRLLENLIAEKTKEFSENEILKRLLAIIESKISDFKNMETKGNCSSNCFCANWHYSRRVQKE